MKQRHNLTAAEVERWRAAKEAGESRWAGPPCRVCGATERFTSNRSSCVPCQQRRAKEHSQKFPLRKAIRAAKWRAKRDGLEFNLVEEDLNIPALCPVLGTVMDTPSLDRLDNSKGYTKNNVRVISWEANRLKHRLSIQQIEALLKYMRDS